MAFPLITGGDGNLDPIVHMPPAALAFSPLKDAVVSHQDTFSGKVIRVIFRSEATGFSVVTVEGEDHERRVVKGTCPPLGEGICIAADGRWVDDKQYGRQLDASLIRVIEPTGKDGVIAYLSSGVIFGIGPALARRIVDVFGEKTVSILDTESARLREVPGIGAKKLAAIRESWDEQKVTRELMVFLSSHGVSPNKATRIYKALGDQAERLVRENPYVLSHEVDGIGFLTADQIALKISPELRESEHRIGAGLVYVLEKAKTDGHTCVKQPQVLNDAVTLLQVDPASVASYMEKLLTEGKLERESQEGEPFVYLPIMNRYERNAAKVVRTLALAPVIAPIAGLDAKIAEAEKKAGRALSESQRAAVVTSATSRISVITGGPGVGKAQPVTEPVLTPSGFRPIGTIRPGDQVVAETGRAVEVLSVHPQGKKRVFRITFEDGRSTLCCDEHLWKTWTGPKGEGGPVNTRGGLKAGWSVEPLSVMRERLARGDQAVAIPLAEPYEGRNALPVPPYVLGVLIACGIPSGGSKPRFTSTQQSTVARVIEALAPLGYGLLLEPNQPGRKCTYQITGLVGRRKSTHLLRWLKSARLGTTPSARFIPDGVFDVDIEARREVLAGLMESIGLSGYEQTACYSASNPKLALGIQRLVRGLGGLARTSIRGKRRIYPVHISGLGAATNDHPSTGGVLHVRSIKSAGTAECVCIAVGSAEHLYVTRDHIVTHNTTSLACLLHVLEAANKQVVLCAPTGRAAKRMSEATGRTAKTIHRTLAFNPRKNGFEFNEQNPLPGDVFVVDESSMLDIPIASRFLRALPAHASVIFIGDVDQLPSVGPGTFLSDMIESKRVPTVYLRTIFRQAAQSKIILAAHAINEGNVPESGDPQTDDFMFFTPPHDPGQTADEWREGLSEKVVKAISRLALERIPMKFGLDPMKDIMVLAPMRKGPLGVIELNKVMQNLLNPKQPNDEAISNGSTTLRPRDRVIQTRNNYQLGVFNGEVGFVIGRDRTSGKVRVRFEGAGTDGNNEVEYSNRELLDLSLAYAMTVHRSQGSEFPAVIMPMTRSYTIMLARNLVYTGVTRGKKLVVMVGDKSALAMAVRNNRPNERCSGLLYRLKLPEESMI